MNWRTPFESLAQRAVFTSQWVHTPPGRDGDGWIECDVSSSGETCVEEKISKLLHFHYLAV